MRLAVVQRLLGLLMLMFSITMLPPVVISDSGTPHSLAAARTSMARAAAPAWRARYATDGDVIVQCCHCRRTRRSDGSDVWDWVPAWVASPPPETSHGICPLCLEYFYPRTT